MSGQQQHTSSPKVWASKKNAAASSSSSFTPEMRDRQARGKDPYDSDSQGSDWAPGQDGSSSGGGGSGAGAGGAGGAAGVPVPGLDYGGSSGDTGPFRVGVPPRGEPFAVLERRRIAAQILDSPELLMMAAQRDDESIPATRLKYTRMLCGIEESSSLASSSSSSSAAGAAHSSPADKQRKRSQHGQGQRSGSGRGSGR
ncbi:hypothetical protein F5Y19DRAFT_204774 [Xylariaceae sp. FL1651]|nr:hypothetical protein F5Y19DRAFT_204774 [Xylariaceae sp. FL1651]